MGTERAMPLAEHAGKPGNTQAGPLRIEFGSVCVFGRVFSMFWAAQGVTLGRESATEGTDERRGEDGGSGTCRA